jgi:cytochrome P450
MQKAPGVVTTVWRAHTAHPVAVLVAWILIYNIGKIAYNLFFHPLRKYPGPLLARSTYHWKQNRNTKGILPQSLKLLHEKYGPIVRLAPNELSFIQGKAWKDIYGYHSGYEMTKEEGFYKPMGHREPDNIITASRERHTQIRRSISHGFSERAMRGQEPIIGGYVDLMISRLAEKSKEGPVDMVAWLNYATFDIITSLGLGHDLKNLENSSNHPWVNMGPAVVKELAFMQLLIQFLPVGFVHKIFQSNFFSARKNHFGYARDRVRERMQLDVERPDFLEGLIHMKEPMELDELVGNAQIIITAGSETTSSLLASTLFLLGKHPEIKARLTKEVRSSFKDEKDITLLSVSHLTYMLAVLNESMRRFPPVAIGFPRVVPKGGHDIAGHFIPENTTVGVWQLPSYHNENNFVEPLVFNPERFLGDPKFANDDMSVLQPFGVGPRNCIGKTLAYAEMRVVLARLLYKFDMELAPGNDDWLLNQRVFTFWHKGPLPIYLTVADGSE